MNSETQMLLVAIVAGAIGILASMMTLRRSRQWQLEDRLLEWQRDYYEQNLYGPIVEFVDATLISLVSHYQAAVRAKGFPDWVDASDSAERLLASSEEFEVQCRLVEPRVEALGDRELSQEYSKLVDHVTSFWEHAGAEADLKTLYGEIEESRTTGGPIFRRLGHMETPRQVQRRLIAQGPRYRWRALRDSLGTWYDREVKREGR